MSISTIQQAYQILENYVWGLVEVTGDFKSGGGFGKDGKYTEFIRLRAPKALEGVKR